MCITQIKESSGVALRFSLGWTVLCCNYLNIVKSQSFRIWLHISRSSNISDFFLLLSIRLWAFAARSVISSAVRLRSLRMRRTAIFIARHGSTYTWVGWGIGISHSTSSSNPPPIMKYCRQTCTCSTLAISGNNLSRWKAICLFSINLTSWA